MKKILILFANTSVRRQRAFPDELKAILDNAALDEGVEMQFYVGYARSLSYFISNEKVVIRDHKNHLNLEDYDLVYFRKAGPAMQQMQACALYLRDRGVPFYDQEIARATSRNKLSQMIMLERKGLPIPTTLFCRNKTRLKRLITKKYKAYFKFPIIVKAAGGSRGESNYLVGSYEELETISKNDVGRSYLIQQFIENDGDYRFFIAGGNLYGVIHRKAGENTHLSNTSKGGHAEIVDVNNFSRKIRSDAVLSAQIFGRSVAGVDIMLDLNTGQHYFLEVNRAPQIERASFEAEKGIWMVKAITSTLQLHQPYVQAVKAHDKDLIGRFEVVRVGFDNDSKKIIAKIDTGADSSTIHAKNILEREKKLVFEIEDKEFELDHYTKKRIKSSNGQLEERFYVELPIQIGLKKFNMKLTLTDRSGMKNTMLIGRRFLRSNRILADVSRRYIMSGARPKETKKVKKL